MKIACTSCYLYILDPARSCIRLHVGSVAQWISAPVSGTGGCGFESRLGRRVITFVHGCMFWSQELLPVEVGL